MAQHVITRSCGCEENHNLLGPTASRLRERRRLANTPCRDCKQTPEQKAMNITIRDAMKVFCDTATESDWQQRNKIYAALANALKEVYEPGMTKRHIGMAVTHFARTILKAHYDGSRAHNALGQRG